MVEKTQDKIAELENKVSELEAQNKGLRTNLETMTSLLRLTVGIAYNAHPELEVLKSTINVLYKA